MRIASADRCYDNYRPGAKVYMVGGDNVLTGSCRCLPVSIAPIDDSRYIRTYVCRGIWHIARGPRTSVYIGKCLVCPANVEQLPYHTEKVNPNNEICHYLGRSAKRADVACLEGGYCNHLDREEA